jgi:hypothetical protein
MKEREPLPIRLQIYILALLISLPGLGIAALFDRFDWPFAKPLAIGFGLLLITALLMAEYVNFPGSSSRKKPSEREK